jgi:hypothetical protein
LLDYYFVGGMPTAVGSWYESQGNVGIFNRITKITQIHTSLIAGYEIDFGKYSDKISAQHIQAVFNNIPVQLSGNIDDSVKRFKFKYVIHKKTRNQELPGPINWLDKCKLISKCQPIDCEPHSHFTPW